MMRATLSHLGRPSARARGHLDSHPIGSGRTHASWMSLLGLVRHRRAPGHPPRHASMSCQAAGAGLAPARVSASASR